ncbi:arginine--tRNA ligase [Granulicella mallensis]|uniref:arginine--tRNA ligase n=1 Tax=Granulicella mallensis (strain ATCC BAA-1857 / DSM 23137 / MP5ACTX8) TaxID=682795 RepID=G8NQG8_GRAMM|nr:arginine--tRNA ligase [Granulicella mallensis]AEU36117.1 Arginine--tRNA ligase [Granulicella mallensis MP5ACTX8]
MYRTLQQAIQVRIQSLLAEKYGVELTNLVIELPPKIEFGEMALPVAFELAKRLKKAPRAIAQELQSALAELPGVASVEIAGAGYLNLKLDRAATVQRIAADEHASVGGAGFRLVEHTSINPNKAAHVGHLRNAILGDSFARMLKPDEFKPGYETGVQNYIDNTGVQVADIVVAVTAVKGMTLDAVREWLTELLETNQRLDYVCWDLYAAVSQWYDSDPAQAAARKQLRLDTLHKIEAGGNDTAEIAELISTGVLRRHLQTMERLGIEYDFLPRESEILHLKFWETARQLMVEKGVLYLETEGKNKGCWVMRRAGVEATLEGPDEDAKIIIRSNGTVTYVGKDIAYHLWKFGLLGKDFGYAKFHEYPTHTCWISTMHGEQPHPSFGHADAIYNVIDSRQDDPQTQVKEALRGMGYEAESDRYTHLNYAMVALTPRCAAELGYVLSEEDKARAFIEVSGRKGFGVKADDLIDRMIAAAQAEVDTRHPELEQAERAAIATAIGVGALRFFTLRFTRNTVIAFDFHDALSFDGETGPYAQYAAVRAANIFRKAGVPAEEALSKVAALDLASMLTGDEGTSVWEVWLTASRLSLVLEQAIAAAEPAMLARYAFQLAQQFNNFYHRHHILTETDETRKTLLLATAAVARRELVRVLGWLGITVPSAM